MKLLPHIFITPRRVALANEETTIRRAGLLGLANEASVGTDGWVKLSPYGDHAKTREIVKNGKTVEQHYIQRVTLENAKRMADSHNSVFGKLRALRRGAPIYRGHADRYEVAKIEGVTLSGKGPALANEKMGIFARLEAREDGFYGQPVFADEGRVAIENDGLKWFSPFWWCDFIGEKDGVPIVEPVEFISAALTKYPNIFGGQALANENGDAADSQTAESNMKKLMDKILGICRAQGIALANEEEATIEAAFDQLNTRLTQRTALENEKTTTLQPRITALENEVQTEKTSHTTTRVSLENARTAHAATLVDLAIAEGRIQPSERSGKLALFGAKGETFEAGKVALANEAVKYHTMARTTEARRDTATTASKASSAMDASKRLVALANEMFSKGGFPDHASAYAAAKDGHPELAKKIEDAKGEKE